MSKTELTKLVRASRDETRSPQEREEAKKRLRELRVQFDRSLHAETRLAPGCSTR